MGEKVKWNKFVRSGIFNRKSILFIVYSYTVHGTYVYIQSNKYNSMRNRIICNELYFVIGFSYFCNIRDVVDFFDWKVATTK